MIEEELIQLIDLTHNKVLFIYQYLDEQNLLNNKDRVDHLKEIGVKELGLSVENFVNTINSFNKKEVPANILNNWDLQKIRRSYKKACEIEDAILKVDQRRLIFTKDRSCIFLSTILPHRITNTSSRISIIKLSFTSDYTFNTILDKEIYQGKISKSTKYFSIEFTVNDYQIEIKGIDMDHQLFPVSVVYFSDNYIGSHIGYLHTSESLDGHLLMAIYNFLDSTNPEIPLRLWDKQTTHSEILLKGLKYEFRNRLSQIPNAILSFWKIFYLIFYFGMIFPFLLLNRIRLFILEKINS